MPELTPSPSTGRTPPTERGLDHGGRLLDWTELDDNAWVAIIDTRPVTDAADNRVLLAANPTTRSPCCAWPPRIWAASSAEPAALATATARPTVASTGCWTFAWAVGRKVAPCIAPDVAAAFSAEQRLRRPEAVGKRPATKTPALAPASSSPGNEGKVGYPGINAFENNGKGGVGGAGQRPAGCPGVRRRRTRRTRRTRRPEPRDG
ncbi:MULTISPECIES: hypothetical protein [unclassified Kitasatospora]|uniref:hypothetical protein n=1 Tax=unclassified Kitasatospora TaxID=2633591 RepID=UPI0033CAFCB4